MEISNETLESFAEDVGLLWCQSNLPILDGPPDSFGFLRDFVSLSKPCIIRSAIKTANEHVLDDFVDRYGDTQVVVAVTPDGNGDCIRQTEKGATFVEPQERKMALRQFRHRLQAKRCKTEDTSEEVFSTSALVDVATNAVDQGVFYYSRQNDCLRKELPNVWEYLGLPRTLQWAEDAFGTGPADAINLWIGNEDATSSMHKDHYQNLFCVLSGEKVFTLCPPADAPFLYEQSFPAGTFAQSEDASWYVQLHEDKTPVRWIAADVTRRHDPEYLAQFPLLKHCHPIQVRVQAGECLYIPALWYHRVTQSTETVGINYWYDMRFDSPEWCYFHFCQNMVPANNA